MQNITISRRSAVREWLPLLALTFSTFIFNTSEFIPIGLLSDIAADFSITESRAGLMITIYAWVVALTSLPLMIIVSGVESKRLMCGIVALFAVSHILSAMSTGFWMLMASRIGVACAHAIFWSIVTPLAVRIAPEGHKSAALSMIVAGSSIAMIVGLPMGRAIGIATGWRTTFFIIGLISFAVLLFLSFVLPKTGREKAFSFKQLPQLLRIPALPPLYLVTVLLVTAHFTSYSYIEPFMVQTAGLKEGTITMLLTLFGVMGLAGSVIFSRYYDRHRSLFMRMAVIGICAGLFLLRPAAWSVQSVIALLALWGISYTFFGMVFQSEVIRNVPDGTSVAMSIYSGIFNVGIGGGALIGGIVCSGINVGAVGYIGGVISIAACLVCLMYLQPRLKK